MSDAPYILDLVTAPVGRVIDVSEMQTWARWDDDSEIGLLGDLIDSATTYVEQTSGRQLLTATYDVSWRRFPGSYGRLYLPRVPVASVTSVKYYATDGTLTTLSGSLYTVNDGSENATAYIMPAFNEQWPSTRGHDRDVVVRFVCGYGGQSSVPDLLKTQIKLLVAHWFENRTAIACGAASPAPLSFTALAEFNCHREFV